MHRSPKGKSLAGVVPLAGRENMLDLPWPDYLQPISRGYLPIERSVYECVQAGCDSIWLVCNDDVAPLVRHRIGDYVLDPEIYSHWNYIKRKEDHKRYIPVFYVPIRQKDRGKRDSLGWSVLDGALAAFTVSSRISRWCAPTKYFVSFPFGVYDPSWAKEHRSAIRGEKSIFLSHEGNTVKNDKYTAFTFTPEEWLLYKKNLKNSCTGGSPSLSSQARWSSRNFSLAKIFNCDNIEADYKIEIEEYYNLDSWENLLDFYKSGTYIDVPHDSIIKPYTYERKKK